MYGIYLQRHVTGEEPEVVIGVELGQHTFKGAEIASRRALKARGPALHADGFRVLNRETGGMHDAFWK